MAGGPGQVRDLQANPKSPQPWHDQYSNGTVTGAIVTGSRFDREELFDILEARHTVVASWAAEKLVIYASGADGEQIATSSPILTLPLKMRPMAMRPR